MISLTSSAAEPLVGAVTAPVEPFTPTESFIPPRQRRAALRLDVASLDALEDAALALDEHGYITYCNRAAEQLYRFDAASMVGRPYRDLVDEQPCVIDDGEPSPAQETGERLYLSDGREMHVAGGG